MLNWNKHTKTKSKTNPTCKFKNCSCVCVSLYTTVIHNTAQNSSDYFLSWPANNRHSPDAVNCRGEDIWCMCYSLDDTYNSYATTDDNILLRSWYCNKTNLHRTDCLLATLRDARILRSAPAVVECGQ